MRRYLFVGAHAMAGTPDGVLCHTVSSEAWYNATINGTLVGESGILAAIAGCWDVPAIFVAGDEATCREVTTLLERSDYRSSQNWLGRFSSRNLAPRDACSLIEMRVAQALSMQGWPQPYKLEGPVTFRVELATPERTNDFTGRTGVVIEGPRPSPPLETISGKHGISSGIAISNTSQNCRGRLIAPSADLSARVPVRLIAPSIFRLFTSSVRKY